MAPEIRPIWILIANDCPVLRLGFKELLRSTHPQAQLAEAAGRLETIELAARRHWDLVLVDLYLSDADLLALFRDLRRVNRQTSVLYFAAPNAGVSAVRAMKSGCQGVVCKTASVLETRKAVNQLLAGKRYLDAQFQTELISAVGQDEQGDAPHNRLSNREFEIMTQILSGRRTKAIATELGLSPQTVSTLRSRLFKKLSIDSEMALARYAINHSLFQVS